MFKLYTDKSNTFKCKVLVEGADEKAAVARLIIEGESHNLMFNGKLKDGVCEVNIGKFKNFDNFKSKGFVKLEVIADDTYFTPWSSEYSLEQSKVVTVEVLNEETSAKPVVEVKEVSYLNDNKKVNSNNHGESIFKQLIEQKIDLYSYPSLDRMIRENIKAKEVIKNYILENNLSNESLESTLEYLVDKF